MAEQDGGQERTEQPTPKRLREARERGQVPRSKELNGMAVMIFGGVALLMFGPGMIGSLKAIFSRTLTLNYHQVRDPNTLLDMLQRAVLDGLILVTPLLIVVLVAALFAPLSIGGWVFSSKSMAFKLEKINPLKGLKKIFSIRGVVELTKAMAKFLVVAAVSAVLLWHLWDRLLVLRSAPLNDGLGAAGEMFVWAFIALSCGLVVIAAVDVPFQVWQHSKQLRMTRQEIRDEMKDTEGKPEVKGRIRSLQQQMAQARMMEEVPKADVVITNPTHVAVALRYDERRMKAPIVVAKGVDLIAARIREIATEHEVTLVEAPLLARALNASTALRQEIPAALYLAVAQILAFVFQLKLAKRYRRKTPSAPDPEVPQAFLDALRKANKPL